MSYVTQPITVGSTTRFRIRAKKDSVVWDITGSVVSLYLAKPDGELLGALTATVTDGPNGVAEYTTATTVLDVDGDWQLRFKVVKGGITQQTRWIPFYVAP